jgi:hypothetical protein
VIIHERWANGGALEDGKINVTNVEFEPMDMEHEVDYHCTMANMFKELKTIFYEGCPTSHLATILLLLNVCNTHGISNMFVDELFSLLRLDLFPRENTFPKS